MEHGETDAAFLEGRKARQLPTAERVPVGIIAIACNSHQCGYFLQHVEYPLRWFARIADVTRMRD